MLCLCGCLPPATSSSTHLHSSPVVLQVPRFLFSLFSSPVTNCHRCQLFLCPWRLCLLLGLLWCLLQDMKAPLKQKTKNSPKNGVKAYLNAKPALWAHVPLVFWNCVRLCFLSSACSLISSRQAVCGGLKAFTEHSPALINTHLLLEILAHITCPWWLGGGILYSHD